MSDSEIKTTNRSTKLNHLFITYLVLCLISLLLVIPFNLRMRAYWMFYDLVPFTASLMILLLPLLLLFPFFDLSRKLIMQSDYKYRFIRSRLTSKILLLTLFVASFIASLVFYSPTSFDMRTALNLCLSGIIVGFFPTVPLMIVFDSFDLPSNYSINRDFKFKRRYFYVALVLLCVIVILLLLTMIITFELLLFLNWIIYGVVAITLVILFILLLVLFYRSEKEKLIPKKKIGENPFFLLILQIVYIGITFAYCILLVLYMFALTRGYLIINFDEFYAGLFLAIHGSYTLFHIAFYSILYFIMRRKGLFDYVEENLGIA